MEIMWRLLKTSISIESVTTNKNQILIGSNGQTVAIVVSHNKEWKKQIESALHVLS